MINKTVAITGHSGIIGSNFLKKFKQNKYIKCNFDITDRKKVFKWIKNIDFDIFIHLAAIVPVTHVDKNKKLSHAVNFGGTKNIVDAILKFKKKKIWFFYSSTSHVYGFKKKIELINEKCKLKPHNYYGKTKVLSEKYIQKKMKKNQIFCIGRIFSFTDQRQDSSFFVPRMFKEVLNKKKKIISLKNPNSQRDFIAVKDIIMAINLLNKKNSKGIFNIATGKSVSLKSILCKIIKISKLKKKIKMIETNKVQHLIADTTKLNKHLNWHAKSNILMILRSYLKKIN